MAHNRLCIYIIHYVQFIILGENPGIWKLWTDYGHYELPEPLMSYDIGFVTVELMQSGNKVSDAMMK